jgi:hypothetical protein
VHYVNPVPAVGILIEMDGGVVLIRRGALRSYLQKGGLAQFAKSAGEFVSEPVFRCVWVQSNRYFSAHHTDLPADFSPGMIIESCHNAQLP